MNGKRHSALKFLSWFCDPEILEDVEGDLRELHFKEDGKVNASYSLWWEVIKLMRPGIIKNISFHTGIHSLDMLRLHFQQAFRHFKRHKTSFLINLLGLAGGLTSTFFIYLWVVDEYQMDAFHYESDQLYQVKQNINLIGKIETIDPTPALLASALQSEYSSVTKAVGVIPPGWYGDDGVLIREEKQFKATNIFAGPAFFDTFSFTLLEGQKSSVLTEKNQLVISKAYAKRIFKDEKEVIGKTLEWRQGGHTHVLIVSGIFDELPSHSTMQFDVVLPMEVFLENYPHIRDWGNSDPSTFIRLAPRVNASAFQAQVENFVASKKDGYKHSLMLQPLKDVYLNGIYENGEPASGRIAYVRLFSAVAALILIIACINFMNLSTARASQRIKEIGIKKYLGIRRSSLINQFLIESFLTAGIALFVSFMLVGLFLPAFNELTGKSIQLIINKELTIFLLGIWFLTSLIAGSYPAFLMSGFNPLHAIKGMLQTSPHQVISRKGLVIFQFCCSIMLISAVMVIDQQVVYIMQKNLGFDKDRIIYFNTVGAIDENQASFIHQLRQIAGVKNASNFGHDLLGDMGTTTGLTWEGKDPETRIRFANLEVGDGLLETFGIELVAGRTYSSDFTNETSKIILNETAIDLMGIQDPLGKTVTLWGTKREIIGIAKDFHLESLHEEILPCFIQYYPELSSIVVKLDSDDPANALAQIEKLFHEFNPSLAFEYSYFDQSYEALYESELQLSSLSRTFAGLAIFISCLGLFGLVTFTIEKRQKEISIRKVLGASGKQLVHLIGKDFLSLIFIAVIIATPLIYYASLNWLEGFSYHVQLSWGTFLIAGVMAIVISMITIGVQTLRIQLINPAETLKDE